MAELGVIQRLLLTFLCDESRLYWRGGVGGLINGKVVGGEGVINEKKGKGRVAGEIRIQ